MNKGFTIKCNNCGEAVNLGESNDGGNNIYFSLIQNERVSITCKCQNESCVEEG